MEHTRSKTLGSSEGTSTTSREWHSKHHAKFSCLYHVVFCPKYRRSVLNLPIAERMKQIIYEMQAATGFRVLALEVLPDHVHMLLDVDMKLGIYDVVRKIKGATASKLRAEFPELVRKLPTLWTRGRFVASVGSVNLDVVKQYIEDQRNK